MTWGYGLDGMLGDGGNDDRTSPGVVSNFNLLSQTLTVGDVVVKTPPTKLNYREGETLDLTGLKVTLIYSDRTSSDVSYEDFAANGVTTSKVNGAALTASDTSIVINVNGHSAKVKIGFSNLKYQLAADSSHMVALSATGKVYTWGLN